MRDKMYTCLDMVLEKLEPCLHTEEKYMPDFISGWYNNTFEEQCKTGDIKTIGGVETLY